MKRPSQANATILDLRTVAKTVAAMVAPVFILPAAFVNVDWSAGLFSPWSIANVASIVASAVFVSAVFRAKSTARAVVFGLAAAFLMTINTTTAFVVASHKSNDARDHRATIIATIERLKSQWSRLSDGRKSAATVAGETPAASIRANLDRTIAAGARRWASTERCDPGATTASASIRLCEQVAALRGSLAAAERRDALDVQIDRLSRDLAALAAPASADPFVDAVVNLAAMLGSPLSPGLAKALPALRDGSLALGLELMAALCPIAWVSLWSNPGPRPVPVAKPAAIERTSRTRAKPETAKPADPFAAFVTARLEKDAGAALKAGDAFKAWQEFCAELGVDAGNPKTFGQQMGRKFTHDRNNNRPLYRGVRFKVELPEHVVPFRAKARA